MFDKNGKLLRKQSVYYFDKKTVSGVRFDKYHITDSNGRISYKCMYQKYIHGMFSEEQ